MTDLQPAIRPDWSHDALVPFERSGLLKRDAVLSDMTPHARNRLTYLAAPHPGADPSRSDLDAFIATASRWHRELAFHHIRSISPVLAGFEAAHFGPQGERFDPLNPATWEDWCFPFFHAADMVAIPAADGVLSDPHIWRATIIALRANRRVFLLSPSVVGDVA